MKITLTLFLLCLLTPAAWCDDFVEPDTGLKFPHAVGEWIKGEKTTYPQPEMGTSIPYSRGAGHTLTLYVYSKGYTSVPSGAAGEIGANEIIEISDSIHAAWEKEGAEVASLGTLQLRDDACAGLFALVSAHRIKHRQRELTSLSGITGYKNRLLKLRYTYRGEDPSKGLAELAKFLKAFLKENLADLDPFFECVVFENFPDLKHHNPSVL